MTLKEKIYRDLNTALKKKAELECSVLRMLNSVIHNQEIEKRTKLWKRGELSEEEIVESKELTEGEITILLLSEIKKRKEAIVEFEKGNRTDLAEKEKKEIEFLKRYLPEQLSAKDIEKMAQETIKKVGAKDIKDLGKIMKDLMPRMKGRAEGQQVSKIVRELLAK